MTLCNHKQTGGSFKSGAQECGARIKFESGEASLHAGTGK